MFPMVFLILIAKFIDSLYLLVQHHFPRTSMSPLVPPPNLSQLQCSPTSALPCATSSLPSQPIIARSTASSSHPLELSLRCSPSELVLWYRCGILCPTRPLARSPARSHPSPARSPAHSLTPLPLTCRVPMPALPTHSPSHPGTRPRRVSTLPLHTTPHISPTPLSVHALSAIDC